MSSDIVDEVGMYYQFRAFDAYEIKPTLFCNSAGK